jgi:CDP-4-dehydro-6-deoxyglucose reductase
MSKKITLLPDKETFVIEGSESILEAAIRAGMSLDYGCANGNCGLCKARLVGGTVSCIRPTDYSLSPSEKAQNYILLCAHTADTDLSIEARAARAGEEIREQRITARIRSIKRVDADVAVLKLRTPRSQRLRFLAGQYASLLAPGLPPYEASIASCPCDDLNLEFHVRKLDGESFSQAVFEKFKVGDELDLVAPRGSFVFDDHFHGPLLFVAFDTGFAAIKSLLEHATAQNEDRVIRLYWIACDEQGHYLDNLCRSWSDAFDDFSYQSISVRNDYATLMEGAAASREIVEGYFRDIVKEMSAASFEDRPMAPQMMAYVSVPEPLIESVRTALTTAGLDPGRMKLEPVRGNRSAACLLTGSPDSTYGGKP